MQKRQVNIFTKLKYQYKRVGYWLRYRTYDRYHVVDTGLPPEYHDKDTIILHVNFSLLVAYVEDECSYMNNWCTKKPKNWRARLPRILRKTLFPISSRSGGLEYIDWQIAYQYGGAYGETDESYAQYRASYITPWIEARELYIWWKDVYPTRKDPSELSGWGAWVDQKTKKYGSFLDRANMLEINYGTTKGYELINRNTPEEQVEERRILDLNHKIEQDQQQEEEDMLIRLMKIRKHLWT